MKSHKTPKATKRIGKYQRYSKNVKRFNAGDAVDSGDDDLSLDNLSFGQAFNAVRNMVPDAKTFTWRGKKYSTAMASAQPKAKPVAVPTTASSDSSEPVNTRAEQIFGALQAKKDAAASRWPAPGASAADIEQWKQSRGIDDRPLEQVRPELALLAPESLGAGAAMRLGASEAAGAGGRWALNRLAQTEAGAASRMAGVDAARAAQVAASKKAAAAAKRAATIQAAKEAAKQKLLEENEYMTQFAMKRGGKVKSKRKCR